jgi:uracil-DNA glycosylase family 4
MPNHDYAELVARRKACRACTDLTNPSAVDDGALDSDHIGPWSRWQGNLSADLMLVGQDWGDTRYFRRFQGLDDDKNPTNRTLMQLLESIGIVIGPPSSAGSKTQVFFTNAVLCLKEGGLQGPVRAAWFQNCAPFLRRQVEIVAPRVVVTLGEHALQAVRQTFGLPRRSLASAVADTEGEILIGHSRLLAVYHCGARVLNSHRPIDAQIQDWARIGNALRPDS